MKKYEVTYHLTNGEIKKVIYKNINVSKQEFLMQMCRGNNNAFTFFADESIENYVLGRIINGIKSIFYT